MGSVDDLQLAFNAAGLAAELALAHFESGVSATLKADGTPVTEADRAVERLLRETLSKARPDDAFIGEELGRLGQSDRVWILDPIDGTRFFSRGDPNWRIHLALEGAAARVEARGRMTASLCHGTVSFRRRSCSIMGRLPQRLGCRVVIVPRSRARLREVQQVVLQVLRQISELQGMSCGIDLAAARVRVRVAQRHAVRLREMLAGHPVLAGDLGAVVVEEVPPERGVTSLGPGSRVLPAGWPEPSVSAAEAIGRPAEELAERYRAEGFTVVVVRYGDPAFFHLDWRKNRIRILVRDGIVVDARQG